MNYQGLNEVKRKARERGPWQTLWPLAVFSTLGFLAVGRFLVLS